MSTYSTEPWSNETGYNKTRKGTAFTYWWNIQFIITGYIITQITFTKLLIHKWSRNTMDVVHIIHWWKDWNLKNHSTSMNKNCKNTYGYFFTYVLYVLHRVKMEIHRTMVFSSNMVKYFTTWSNISHSYVTLCDPRNAKSVALSLLLS